MGSGITKPAQSSEAVEENSKGYRKDGRNGAGPGSNVQGGGTVGVTIWKQELGGDQGDTQDPGGVPPSVGATDQGDDGETWGMQRVGISSGRGGDGTRGDQPRWSINQYVAEKNVREGGLPAYVCIVHRSREDSRDETNGALVVSRRGN